MPYVCMETGDKAHFTEPDSVRMSQSVWFVLTGRSACYYSTSEFLRVGAFDGVDNSGVFSGWMGLAVKRIGWLRWRNRLPRKEKGGKRSER